MKRVIVIMSTYNGSKNLCRQLDSIFQQRGVEVSVVIRDDNSKDNTLETLEEYINRNRYQISYIKGKNEGYAKSFWDALCLAGDADYYAFSDQDDVWKKDKLIKSIQPMENSGFQGPMLSYCKMQRSDEQLKRLDEQVDIIKPEKITKKLTLTQTFNYGAATVFNKDAKDLICRCWPDSSDVPHDLWAGMLCYWFGKVFYVDEELYYWIRYGTSVTGEGTKRSGIKYRIKESLKRKSYPNVAGVLLKEYSELLNEKDRRFLEMVVGYRTSVKNRVGLLLDKDFRRYKASGTFALKMGILFGWY